MGWQSSTKFQHLEWIKVYIKRAMFDLIFMLWFCLFICLAYMFNFVSNYIACCLINFFFKEGRKKNKWKWWASDPLKGWASDPKKKDGLVIKKKKDGLVIQVNFWWVGNVQRNFNLWKESKPTSRELGLI